MDGWMDGWMPEMPLQHCRYYKRQTAERWASTIFTASSQLCAPLMPLSKHNSFCFGLASACILQATWKGENRIEKGIKLFLYEIKRSLLPSWLSSFLWFWFAARNLKKKRGGGPPLLNTFVTPQRVVQFIPKCFATFIFVWRVYLYRNTAKCS
jgi:hypothetical protein